VTVILKWTVEEWGVDNLAEFSGSEKELQPAAVKTVKKFRNYNITKS
jgi:hypothetical protein